MLEECNADDKEPTEDNVMGVLKRVSKKQCWPITLALGSNHDGGRFDSLMSSS